MNDIPADDRSLFDREILAYAIIIGASLIFA